MKSGVMTGRDWMEDWHEDWSWPNPEEHTSEWHDDEGSHLMCGCWVSTHKKRQTDGTAEAYHAPELEQRWFRR